SKTTPGRYAEEGRAPPGPQASERPFQSDGPLSRRSGLGERVLGRTLVVEERQIVQLVPKVGPLQCHFPMIIGGSPRQASVDQSVSRYLVENRADGLRVEGGLEAPVDSGSQRTRLTQGKHVLRTRTVLPLRRERSGHVHRDAGGNGGREQ